MNRAIELILIIAFGAIIYGMSTYGLPPQPFGISARAAQVNTCTDADLDRLAPSTKYLLNVGRVDKI